MRYDPIPDLVRLGYTWREAAFLQLVGINSGFFLRRQYCEFLGRKLGALPQQLTEKGADYGHIEALGYAQRRHVYHLKSRMIYCVLGNEESDNHRPKGDVEIKTRLMILDYLLENRKQPLLTLDKEKIKFFLTDMRVPHHVLPAKIALDPNRSAPLVVRHFPERFPIHRPAVSTGNKHTDVRFTYFDYGALSVKRFVRFLDKYRPLLQEVGAFGVIYVADSERNLPAAARAFSHAFPRNSRLLPFGVERLMKFFAAQTLWDNNDPKFSQEDLVALKEGGKVYTLPEHTDLRAAWLKGRKQFDAQLSRLGEKQLVRGTFTSHILQRTYPIFGNRYSGKPAGKASESQIQPISNFESIAS